MRVCAEPFALHEELTSRSAKERQRYRAIAELDPARYAISDDGDLTVMAVPPAIKAGAAQGKLDKALAAYRGELARCKTKLITDGSQAQRMNFQF